MDQNTIQSRFEKAIADAARRLRVKLGHGNEHQLPAMAAAAAAQIVATVPDGPARELMVAKGEIAFASLILEMVRAAETIDGYPPGIIGEQTLDLALRVKGPFPPFW